MQAGTQLYLEKDPVNLIFQKKPQNKTHRLIKEHARSSSQLNTTNFLPFPRPEQVEPLRPKNQETADVQSATGPISAKIGLAANF